MAKPLPPSSRVATDTKPWYRQAWPWGLILGPSLVVVGCMVTIWLAVKNADPVVVDDYYKEGLAINRSLERDHAAQTLGLQADFQLLPDGRLTVQMQANRALPWPDALDLLMAHPARAERDVKVILHVAAGQGAGARYTADIPAGLDAVRYRLVLQDSAGQWRLAGHVNPGQQRQVQLVADPQGAPVIH